MSGEPARPARLAGARLHVRSSVEAEPFAESLRCHASQAWATRANDLRPHDPLLSGSIPSVDVERHGELLLVTIHSGDDTAARDILARASSLAARSELEAEDEFRASQHTWP